MHLSGRRLPQLGTSSRASRAPNSSDIGDCRRDTFGLELSNISAVPRGGDFGEPVRKAFACALASNCTRSAVVTDSDETARRSHAEPPGAVAAKVLGVLAPGDRQGYGGSGSQRLCAEESHGEEAPMGKIVECAKVDPASGCKHVVRGETEEEVLKKAGEHA